MSNTVDENQWQCRNCDQVFETRGKRDSHQRKEHHNTAITDNELISVKRSTTSKEFGCPCGKTFSYGQSLKRHAKTCNEAFVPIGSEMLIDHTHEDEGILL